MQAAGADAGRDERAHAAFVLVTLGDDTGAEARGKSVDLEVRRRAFDLVDQAQHVGDRHRAQPGRQRAATLARASQRVEQTIDRAVLAEEQQFVLAAEVVVKVAWRQIGGDRDVTHAGGGKTAGAEDPRGGAHDRDPASLGAE